MPRPDHHLFVCQNERPLESPRGSCQARGGAEVLAAFKALICERGLRNRIEFDGSTCLDTCAWGPVVVVYPEGVWYGKVTLDDVPVLVEAIAEGRVVERLLVPADAVRKS